MGSTQRELNGRPVALHWNGKQFRLMRPFVPSSTGGTHSEGSLSGVAAVAADDVWAVGDEHAVTGGKWPQAKNFRAVVVHWDGSTWSRVPVPGLAHPADSALARVTTISRDDVWAVGWDGDGPLVIHWDGQGWQVRNPPTTIVARDGVDLLDVDATSAGDVWVVGQSGWSKANNRADLDPLALHWDGQSWRNPSATFSSIEGTTGVESVDARTAASAWTLTSDSYDRDSIVYWNGHRQRSTYDAGEEIGLQDIAAASSKDVWVVGGRYDYPAVWPVVMRWNGTSWRIQKTPLDRLKGSDLSGLSVISPKDIWAVGDHLIARYSR